MWNRSSYLCVTISLSLKHDVTQLIESLLYIWLTWLNVMATLIYQHAPAAPTSRFRIRLFSTVRFWACLSAFRIERYKASQSSDTLSKPTIFSAVFLLGGRLQYDDDGSAFDFIQVMWPKYDIIYAAENVWVYF